MSFSNIKKVDNHTAIFTLAPITVSYANTLRRLILTGVESVGFRGAIDSKGRTGDIVIKHNDTPITNESLAHRISLLPINVRAPLQFEGDKYKFILKVKNDSDRPLDVCAGDFEVYEQSSPEAEPVRVATETFFPVNPVTGDTALIAVLKGKQFGQAKGEMIELEAKGSIGNGRENAGFMSVSQISYVYTPNPDPEELRKVFERWLESSKNIPVSELTPDDPRRSALEKEFRTMEIARCYLKDKRGEPYSYDFTIETIGVLTIPYIVQRACEVGEAMFRRYENVDSGELPAELTIQKTTMQMTGFDFFFKGHDHTLGNALQTFMVESMIEPEEKPIEALIYAGYKVPHPLHDVMQLTIGLNADITEETARQCLAYAARGVADLFRKLRTEWMTAVGRK
jgi:DNA-directed RNA polymerase subunit L